MRLSVRMHPGSPFGGKFFSRSGQVPVDLGFEPTDWPPLAYSLGWKPFLLDPSIECRAMFAENSRHIGRGEKLVRVDFTSRPLRNSMTGWGTSLPGYHSGRGFDRQSQ